MVNFGIVGWLIDGMVLCKSGSKLEDVCGWRMALERLTDKE